MSLLLLLITLLSLLLLSHAIIRTIPDRDRIESVGLTLLLWPLISSFTAMITYQLFGQFSLILMLTFSLALHLLVLLLQRTLPRPTLPRWTELASEMSTFWQAIVSFDKNAILLTVVLGFLAATVFINSASPVSDWDAIALYDFRGLLIEVDHNWEAGRELGYFYHYPPFTSLLHGIVYLGGVHVSKLWYTELFIGFLFVFYSLLRRRTNELQAIVGVFLVTFSPIFSEHIVVAYTNLPYSIYFALAVLYAVEWFLTQRNQDLLWCMVCVGAASWVRQAEPFWLVLILGIASVKLFRGRVKSWQVLFSSVAVFLGIHYYWPTYVAGLQLPADLPGTDTTTAYTLLLPVTLGNLFLNLFQVIDYLWVYLLTPQLLLVSVVATALWFDHELLRKAQIKILLGIITTLVAMVFVGTYYFSFTYRTWDLIGGSVTRMSMFFVPLFIYILVQTEFWRPILGLPNLKAMEKQDRSS